MMDVDPAHEKEFNEWYDEEHLPERTRCPGFLSGRRFRAVEGSPRYLALYDLERTEVLHTPAYLKIFDPSPRTQRIQQFVTSEIRNVYVEITTNGGTTPPIRARARR
jgi:hypothetical protein